MRNLIVNRVDLTNMKTKMDSHQISNKRRKVKGLHNYESNKENVISDSSKGIILKNANGDIQSQLSPRKTESNSMNSVNQSNDMP